MIHKNKYPRRFNVEGKNLTRAERKKTLRRLHEKHIQEVCNALDRPDPYQIYSTTSIVTGVSGSYYIWPISNVTVANTRSSTQTFTWPPVQKPKKNAYLKGKTP